MGCSPRRDSINSLVPLKANRYPPIAVASVSDALTAATDALAAAGCDTPRLDAELLLADALRVERSTFVIDPQAGVPAHAARLMGEHVRRRAAREPVAYIVGHKGFRQLDLAVDSRVLVPRPETELLVEVALELPRGASVHDVGTGSGAVALAVAHERPDLQVSASDSSAAAVEVARANAARLRLPVEVELATGLPPARSDVDLVVANLPYVAEPELRELAPEILLHEPRDALLAGADGLDAIRSLLAGAPFGLRLALEHGSTQGEAVRALLDAPSTLLDLAGHERVTLGRAP
jgi:release factor glutamine methyltransferase